jgi:hypothetical protein
VYNACNIDNIQQIQTRVSYLNSVFNFAIHARGHGDPHIVRLFPEFSRFFPSHWRTSVLSLRMRGTNGARAVLCTVSGSIQGSYFREKRCRTTTGQWPHGKEDERKTTFFLLSLKLALPPPPPPAANAAIIANSFFLSLSFFSL